MDRIEMLDLNAEDFSLRDQINKAIETVIERGDFINGISVKSFRKELESYLNVPHIIPCGNGTDALQISLMALDLPPGGEIITPAFSYAATAEVIKLLGYKPVFVDVDPSTFNIDPNLIVPAITEHTCAIMPVHLYGQCADMNAILGIAANYNLKVIEDAAQALGSGMEINGKGRIAAGAIGDIGGYSFFPSKNLGAYGDGGAIVTTSEELAVYARSIANHGQTKQYIHKFVGVNSRLDSIQAAILSVKLTALDLKVNRRKAIAHLYNEAFASNENLEIPKRTNGIEHVYHQYTLRTKGINRDEIVDLLDKNNISARIYYPTPLHLQTAYFENSSSALKKLHFPIAELLAETVFSIPVHPALTDDQVNYIIETINKICSDR